MFHSLIDNMTAFQSHEPGWGEQVSYEKIDSLEIALTYLGINRGLEFLLKYFSYYEEVSTTLSKLSCFHMWKLLLGIRMPNIEHLNVVIKSNNVQNFWLR